MSMTEDGSFAGPRPFSLGNVAACDVGLWGDGREVRGRCFVTDILTPTLNFRRQIGCIAIKKELDTGNSIKQSDTEENYRICG